MEITSLGAACRLAVPRGVLPSQTLHPYKVPKPEPHSMQHSHQASQSIQYHIYAILGDYAGFLLAERAQVMPSLWQGLLIKSWAIRKCYEASTLKLYLVLNYGLSLTWTPQAFCSFSRQKYTFLESCSHSERSSWGKGTKIYLEGASSLLLFTKKPPCDQCSLGQPTYRQFKPDELGSP